MEKKQATQMKGLKGALYSLIAGASITFLPQVSSSKEVSTQILSAPTLESRLGEKPGRTARPNVDYSSLIGNLDGIEYKDRATKGRFGISMLRLKKHGLEKHVDEYCAKFKVHEEDVLPYMVIESALNQDVGTSKGCVGIGQMSSIAVKAVNKFYGTKFVHGGNAKNQIGSAVAYFAKTYHSMAAEYPKADQEALLNLAYFSYNAGGAPVRLATSRVKRKHLPLTWNNVKAEITPELLSASAKLYRGLGEGARRQKVKIIKSYISKAGIYRGYLEQLREIESESQDKQSKGTNYSYSRK